MSKSATHLIKIAAEAVTGKRDHVLITGNDFDTPDGTGIVYVRREGDAGRSVWRAGLSAGAPAVEISGSAGAEHFALTGDQIVVSRVAERGFRLLSLRAP